MHQSRAFAPVFDFPDFGGHEPFVFDFSRGPGGDPRFVEGAWGIGRYGERRPGVYTAPQYGEIRDTHLGIDFFGPAGTPVRSCAPAVVDSTANNSLPQDYGHTLILRFEDSRVDGWPPVFWALYGHLSAKTLDLTRHGQRVSAGEVIGWLGDRSENGGWAPHLHFQISLVQPKNCDMPGAAAWNEFETASRTYPDPRRILGRLYE